MKIVTDASPPRATDTSSTFEKCSSSERSYNRGVRHRHYVPVIHSTSTIEKGRTMRRVSYTQKKFNTFEKMLRMPGILVLQLDVCDQLKLLYVAEEIPY